MTTAILPMPHPPDAVGLDLSLRYQPDYRRDAVGADRFNFELPATLEAGEPPEARGLARDEVRLMVSRTPGDEISHMRFRDLPDVLQPGDVVVVNTSGTLNAALRATDPRGKALELHLSTQLPGSIWTVEVREPSESGTVPYGDVRAGEQLSLEGGGSVGILARYDCGCDGRAVPDNGRLWQASLHLPGGLDEYLARYGFPFDTDTFARAGPWSITRRCTRPSREVRRCPVPAARLRPS